MNDTIAPALSREDWAKPFDFSDNSAGTTYDGRMVCCFGGVTAVVPDRSRHAHAAIALEGMPFGFTWDDVDALNAAADYVPPRLASIAARIAALLPPR